VIYCPVKWNFVGLHILLCIIQCIYFSLNDSFLQDFVSFVLQDVQSRVDLRHVDICSVDPPGCTDIDDALHCKELENGNYEVETSRMETVNFTGCFVCCGLYGKTIDWSDREHVLREYLDQENALPENT